MRLDNPSQPSTRPSSVEPSRAWILGLVVDADGSVSGPLPVAPEWPSPDGLDTRPDHIMSQDGPSVRP